MTVHVFGIRHHGPGSARSLRAALDALAPDVVLVEGPPDAHGVVPLVAHEAMKPPVALLVYASDAPENASFFPLAVFSPEWQALRYAAEKGVPARFIDLPQAHELAERAERKARAEADASGGGEGVREGAEDGEGAQGGEGAEGGEEEELLDDPIGVLSRAAGYDDRELWWEHQIEQRLDARGMFEGILEAIAALRADRPPPRGREGRREAFMRRSIRAAEKEGFQRIAVVCGAWHAPALVGPASVKDDDALLKGLPKTKVEATWIPWTYGRLASASGYGAGVASPGWYEHLWRAKDQAAIHWTVRVARLLRDAQIDASSASVIETVRLAEALAALRELPMAGLAELGEAIQAVLCGGEAAPMALVRERLVVGGELGEVPEETPTVPLQRDLSATQKTLRLKPSAEPKLVELDLRADGDRARSRLFHRLRLLAVAWATPAASAKRGEGTFREAWTLEWRPELAIAVVEANVFGNTVEGAATARTLHRAREATALPELTALLAVVLVADLPSAVDPVLARIEELSLASDVLGLMRALPDLVRAARYGDVRETRGEHLLSIAGALFERVVVGLPGACASLDDDAARAMLDGLRAAHEAIVVLDRAEMRAEWLDALTDLHLRDAVHGLVRGGACRVLVEQRRVAQDALERVARLALSSAVPSASAAAWLEGLLDGSAQLLLHHDGVWAALDAWIASKSPEAFTEELPLVRRAFASFGASERRTMAEKVRALGGGAAPRTPAADVAIDPARAALVVPVLSTLLGAEIHAAD